MTFFAPNIPYFKPWNTDGMNDDDAAEMRSLVDSIAAYIDGPDFAAKAVGHDALAVAKRDRDLVALRNYDRLFPTGINPRDIKDAVNTGKKFRNGGLSDITVEQVQSHAIVFKAIKGANGGQADRIRKIALTHPGQGDFIVELIADREIGDPTQIIAILEQAKTVAPVLHDGVL